MRALVSTVCALVSTVCALVSTVCALVSTVRALVSNACAIVSTVCALVSTVCPLVSSQHCVCFSQHTYFGPSCPGMDQVVLSQHHRLVACSTVFLLETHSRRELPLMATQPGVGEYPETFLGTCPGSF